MITFSKPLIEGSNEFVKCSEFFHEGQTCLEAPFNLIGRTIKSLLFFFMTMYAAQLLLAKKKLTKDKFKKLIIDFLWSEVNGLTYGTLYLIFSCTVRNAFGKFYYYLTGFVGGIVNGFSVFTSPYHRRTVETFSFSTSAIEGLIRLGAHKGIFPKSYKAGALMFMILNSYLMYLLWLKINRNADLSINWLFKPDRKSIIENDQICYHAGTCWSNFLRKTGKYTFVGLLISQALGVLKILQNGHFDLNEIVKRSRFRLPAFFAFYIGLYNLTNCGLNRWFREENPVNSAAAGFASGISYLIRPSLNLPVSAGVLIIMCGWEHLKKLGIVPSWPYREAAFIISSGVNIHLMVNHQEQTAPFYLRMLSFATGGWSDGYRQKLDKFRLG